MRRLDAGGGFNFVPRIGASQDLTLTGGTGSYQGVHGQGSWTADASTFPYIRHTETGTIERD